MVNHSDLKKLLDENPKGIVILPHGKVYKIIAYATSLQGLVRDHPLPPTSGGYYVVEDIDEE